MKVILLRGGVGNQLFIYGAYQYFKSLNRNLFIDDFYGFKNDYVYERTNSLIKLNLSYNSVGLSLSLVWRILNLIKDNSSYYFFSNQYFQDSKFLDFVGIEFSPIVKRICVHIRLKDYPLKLDELVYLKMLECVLNENPGLSVFFVTDDKNYFKEHMKLISSKGDCLDLCELKTFQFIAESSHVILSDSSFSFCAAYLGDIKCIFYHRLSNISNNGIKCHTWKKL